MTLFNAVMQTEKLTAIGFAVIIIGALTVFLFMTYGGDIIENLFGGEGETNTIETGDCVDVNYIGRYASTNSIFDTSYADVENKTDGTPLKVFVTLNSSEMPPEDYEDYGSGLITGFMEGLSGLKEGETATIGPIPPEKAYGIKPQTGDTISVPDPTEEGKYLRIDVGEITENSPMPEEFIEYFGNVTTTLYILTSNYSVGEEMPLYPSWVDSSFVSKINETRVWIYTTPPEDKQENFTWIDNVTGSPYWENASSVTTLNDSTIVVTHTPEIGATMDYSESWYVVTTYTVVNLTDDKINVSYTDSAGNTSYSEFDRTITIERNQSQVIHFEYPLEGFKEILAMFKAYYDPDLIYSLDGLAGETLLFEVTIEEVNKTSQS